MTGRPHHADRGLSAVARVRSVRETDSRIGLQQMLSEEAAVTRRLVGLEGQVAGVPAQAITTPGALLARGTALANLGVLIRETRSEADTAAIVTAEARARWSTDKSRLSAVEHLLARRAEARRTEEARRDARDADDLAAQRWARTSRGHS